MARSCRGSAPCRAASQTGNADAHHREDPGFDETFVGFADAHAQDPEYRVPASAPQQADPPSTPEARDPAPEQEKEEPQISHEEAKPPEKPPEPPPEKAPVEAPSPPSRSRFLERVQIFRDWLSKHFEARDIFILDREGKVIFDESGHGRLHFMARNLAVASKGSGNIHVKIGPSAILEVIPSETPYGRIILGMLVPDSLSPPHVKIIGEVLLQTASPT